MQQYVTATVFAATLIVSALSAAAEPVPPAQVEYHQQPQQVYYYQQPAPQAQQYYQAQPAPQQQQTFFGRMMELERRKNQAILRFFGLR